MDERITQRIDSEIKASSELIEQLKIEFTKKYDKEPWDFSGCSAACILTPDGKLETLFTEEEKHLLKITACRSEVSALKGHKKKLKELSKVIKYLNRELVTAEDINLLSEYAYELFMSESELYGDEYGY